MAEQGDEALLHLFAHHVLPPTGLDVDVPPVKADDVQQKALGEPMLSHDRDGALATEVRQLEVAIVGHHQQAVALHARNGLADGRSALVQALRDPGTQREDALLFELEDGAEVHLGGIDQVVQAGDPF